SSVITLDESVVEVAIFDSTTIYVHVLILARGARNAGRADEAPESKGGELEGWRVGLLERRIRRVPRCRSLKIHGLRPGCRLGICTGTGEIDLDEALLVAVEGAQALAEGVKLRRSIFPAGHSRQLPNEPAIFLESESHFRIGQGR